MEHLDLSSWSEDHPIFNKELSEEESNRLKAYRKKNKKRLTTFSPECEDKEIIEVFITKAKQYFLRLKNIQNQQETNKMAVKGAMRGLFDIQYPQYMKFLLGKDKFELFYESRNFVSKNHVVSLNYKRRKICDRYCDKRFILLNGLSSVSHGHYLAEIMLQVQKLLNDLIDML